MALVERELQGEFLGVFKDIFKNEKYEYYSAVSEKDRADIMIYHKQKKLFFIELKDPKAKDGKSVENAGIFQREFKRAKRIDVPHFGITNFTEAIIHSLTEDVGEENRENYEFRNFPTERDIEKYRNQDIASKTLLSKLKNLADWYLLKAESILVSGDIPKQLPDEIFILKIQKTIFSQSPNLSDNLYEKYQNSQTFKTEVQKYFHSQQWAVPTEESDFDNFSHIAILMYISKLIFYKAIKDYGVYKLREMKNSEDIDLEGQIWGYFQHLKKETGDFELLIGDNLAIENRVIFFDKNVAKNITDEVLENSEKYDFSKMREDIIGRIFEELIKPDERHKLGQYFTSSNVVKVINSFCIREKDSKVLDPSCGSGAFLTAVYERKKDLGETEHSELLNHIYGVDISSYPAYLSILNLAVRNLGEKSYPRIIQKDFFQVGQSLENKKISVEKVLDSDGKEKLVEFSKFDAIVGNPPYTRQEDIDSYNSNQKKIIETTLISELSGFAEKIPKRTSIYGYFFYRAKRLLKDGGYLGFITSNSWLDVDFGETLQKYMVENFKVVAIIDSKVERFFESADVNTNITILRKCKEGEKFNNRFKTKFVYLKKPLSDVLKKFDGEDGLRNFIENQNEIFEDEYLRVNPVLQLKLLRENKWSKFLKAPKIYWDILEKGKGKWKRLGDVAEIRRGFTTGVNEFFYLKTVEKNGDSTLMENGVGEHHLIENQFLKPVIKSPREIGGYVVNPKDLKFLVLMVNGFSRETIFEKFPNLEKYLRRGEERGYHERSTTKSRRRWWELPDLDGVGIVTSKASNGRHKFYLNNNNYVSNNRFYELKNGNKSIFLIINSLFIQFQIQINANSLGEGVIDLRSSEIKNLLIPKITLNCKTTNITKIQRQIDTQILLSLGYEKSEIPQIRKELYSAVSDLVNSRLNKAKSVKKSSQKRKTIPIETYLEEFKELLDRKPEYSSEYLKYISDEVQKITPDKKIQKKILSPFWKEQFLETLPTLAKLKKAEKEKEQPSLF